ncbi:MAG TPA: dihydroorotate dehydrogenase, partial [Candidatus Nanoarchaeia archaeon]|nr:dihydroorotate dehydrogenase [Candidatus Nanoarchaeia archaeon]
GHALKPIAVNCIYDIYEAVKIPIIGIGGVTTGEDAVEMIMAGAVAVEIGTAIYYRGIDVFRKVSDEIKQFMTENGYSTIKEMVGMAHEK